MPDHLPDLTLAGLLFETTHALKAQLADVHARHGLTGTDFDALLRLSQSPGAELRMSDLAAQTALSTSGVTRLVDRLGAAGLAERRLDPQDRRSWIVTLTPQGRAVLDAAAADAGRLIHEVLTEPLGTSSAQLARLLRRARDLLHPDAARIT